MHITKTLKNDVLVCSIKGEINIDTVNQLRDLFTKITDDKTSKVLLNFSQLEYIDSLGMATLAKFAQQLKANSGELVICSMSPKLGSIFRIVKFGKVFRIFDSEDEALEKF